MSRTARSAPVPGAPSHGSSIRARTCKSGREEARAQRAGLRSRSQHSTNAKDLEDAQKRVFFILIPTPSDEDMARRLKLLADSGA
jgi:hypothetical protein